MVARLARMSIRPPSEWWQCPRKEQVVWTKGFNRRDSGTGNAGVAGVETLDWSCAPVARGGLAGSCVDKATL